MSAIKKTWSVYFIREPWFDTEPDEPTDLEGFEEVALLSKQRYPTLDAVYKATQNDESPWCQPPMRSMSVGDVVRDNETNELWLCFYQGWKRLALGE